MGCGVVHCMLHMSIKADLGLVTLTRVAVCHLWLVHIVVVNNRAWDQHTHPLTCAVLLRLPQFWFRDGGMVWSLRCGGLLLFGLLCVASA